MTIPEFKNIESAKDRHVYKKDGEFFAFNGVENKLVKIDEDKATKIQSKILKAAKLAAEAEQALKAKDEKGIMLAKKLNWVKDKIAADENAMFDAEFTRLILNAPIDESKMKRHKNGAVNFSIEYVRDLADQFFYGRVEEMVQATPVIDFVKGTGKVAKEITYLAHVTVTYPVSRTVRTVVGAATGTPGMVFSTTRSQSTGTVLAAKALKSAYQKLGVVFGRYYNSREEEAETYNLATDSAPAAKITSM